MSFTIGDVASGSVDRLTTTAGAIVVIALAAVGIAQSIVLQDIVRGFLEWVLDLLGDPAFRAELTGEQRDIVESLEADIESTIAELPLAVGLDPWIAALLWLVLFVVSLAVIVMALDTFGNERDEFAGIETERIGWKTLNLFVGIVVFWILFTIGLAFFVIPGLIFAVFMFFFPAAIALRDESFFAAYASSAGIVRRNALATLGVIVVAILAMVVLWIVGAFIPGVAGTIVGDVLSAIGMSFVFALMALAYVDAVDEEESDEGDEPAGVNVASDTV